MTQTYVVASGGEGHVCYQSFIFALFTESTAFFVLFSAAAAFIH